MIIRSKTDNEYSIRDNLEILKILLKDRTINKNLIWATDNYYSINPKDTMKVSVISNGGSLLVTPRIEKASETQINRTKERAEVFTPTWIVKKQNDIVDSVFKDLPLLEYVGKTWLEITCGEGPYMTSRYDTVTGKKISLEERVGFVDRKLQRITNEIDDHEKWIELSMKAYKASYGYEFHGDSLLIARENLLYTFIEYYQSKFKKMPSTENIKEISKIISYNVFQMDGLKYIIPYSEESTTKPIHTQLSLFEEIGDQLEIIEIIENGEDVKIKDWNSNKIIKFKNIITGGKNMKFDVVIGNPPYQENNADRNRDDAIYPHFYETAEKIGEKYCLISPARFLFGVGSTPAIWNEKMLHDEHIKVSYFNQNSSEVFINTDIKGGVAILYRDSHKKFGPIGTFTPIKELESILKKVENDQFESLSDLLSNTNGYRYTPKLYEDFPKYSKMEKGGGKNSVTSNTFEKFKEVYFEDSFEDSFENNKYAKIYGRRNNERVFMKIKRDYIVPGPAFENFKVFVPAANGSGAIGEVLSTPVIGHPVIGHTQTFISIGNFETEYEANSLLKYLKGKFSRTMLGIKKTTQNNKTKETWSKVPIQDFTESSDIDWSMPIPDIDQQLYKKYDLSQEEIDFIETNVKEME